MAAIDFRRSCDEDGDLRRRGLRSAAPKRSASDAFFGRSRRRDALVAPSGLGKSTVLVRYLLKRLRAGDLAVFLTGRHLRYAALEETADYLILRGMRRDKVSLASFERFLGEIRQIAGRLRRTPSTSTPARGGAAALLESIIAFVQNQRLRGVRVVAGCRSETWARYRERTRSPKPLAGAHFYTDDAIVLTDFDDGPAARAALLAYRDAYALAPASFRQLGNGVKGLSARRSCGADRPDLCLEARFRPKSTTSRLFDAAPRAASSATRSSSSHRDDPRSKYFRRRCAAASRFSEPCSSRLRSPTG